MAIKKTTDTQAAAQNATEGGNNVGNDQTVNSMPKVEKRQETANNGDTEKTYIYIGPTTKGLVENTIVKGTRESVEEYLKDVIAEIPQVKMLIVPTESLAVNRAKAKQAGTLLNKYYNDVLGLSRKGKEA